MLTDPLGCGSVSQGSSWRFPRAMGRVRSGLPALLLSQPQGLLWVSYALLYVRLNLIIGDKVLQSRPLKVLYKDAALK